MTASSDVSDTPLLIGGMGRSGTSLTASLFAGAGLDIGPELLGANASNPMGHFEDLGFFQFHRRALVAQGLGSEGYTAGARGAVPAMLVPEADDLIASRKRSGVAWGWKEPRTTLFLDFWQERLPDARHLFVFRRPWEVADSFFRRGDDTFALNPAFALDVWTHYNRLIIDFVRRHPDRCLVFEISQVIADPEAVLAAVRARLDVPLGPAAPTYVDRLFGRDEGSGRATIVRNLAPEAWSTYLELCDLAGSVAAPERSGTPLAECVVLEWARASRTAALAREAEARIRAEAEERLRVEAEERMRVEAEECARVADAEWMREAAAERRRRRSPAGAIGRLARKVSAGVTATWRRRSRPEHHAPAENPDLLAFPKDEAPRPTRRAA